MWSGVLLVTLRVPRFRNYPHFMGEDILTFEDGTEMSGNVGKGLPFAAA
jgi:hypothetical protein